HCFLSSRRRHTRSKRDWSSDVCSSDLKEQGIDAEIFACPASEADDKMAQQEIDCVLLGPQVSYMKGDFENKVKGKGKDGKDIPLDVINMQDYGMMNGANVLAQAEKLIKGE